jgi:hypothetical protein
MRIPAQVSVGLILTSAMVSALLGYQLHAERQRSGGLSERLAATQTPGPQLQPAADSAPPSAAVTAVAAAPDTPQATAVVQAASAVVAADAARRQKVLLEDTEFRASRIAQARANLQLRFPNLATDLGLSQQEVDALLNVVADYQLRQDAAITDAMNSGSPGQGATPADLVRAQQEVDQQRRNAMAALIGPERAAAYQEYEETAASRRRAVNLGEMLTQAGKPLSAAQSKSLSAALVTEQRRQEGESKVTATSPLAVQQALADRAIDGDRRVLAAAAAFLDAQQLELVRARFEQVAGRTRANASVQQRELEVAVQPQEKVN